MADHCRSCGAPIDWAITVRGSRIPLDIGRRLGPDGNVSVVDGIAHVVKPGDGDRISHFVTCPNADRHRKRDRR
jgi:hypothetical protein